MCLQFPEPTSVTVTQITATSIAVGWKKTSSGAGMPIQYLVFSPPMAGSTGGVQMKVCDATPCPVDGLMGNNKYTITVTACPKGSTELTDECGLVSDPTEIGTLPAGR